MEQLLCVVVDIQDATASTPDIQQYITDIQGVKETWVTESKQKMIITYFNHSIDRQHLLNKLSTQFSLVNEVRSYHLIPKIMIIYRHHVDVDFKQISYAVILR